MASDPGSATPPEPEAPGEAPPWPVAARARPDGEDAVGLGGRDGTGAPFAGLGVRALAYLIDVVVLVTVSAPFALLTGPEDETASLGFFLATLVEVAYLGWLPTTPWRGTLGKKALGLRIETLDGRTIGSVQSLIRLGPLLVGNLIVSLNPIDPETGAPPWPAMLAVLALTVCYGLIQVHPQRRGLHDLLAGTCVRRARRVTAEAEPWA